MHSFEDVIKKLMKGNDRSFWDYVASIRGDDTEVSLYKYLFTCPIRGEIEHNRGSAYTIRQTKELLEKNSNGEIIEKFVKSFSKTPVLPHYLAHVSLGFKSLAEYYDAVPNNHTSVLCKELSDTIYLMRDLQQVGIESEYKEVLGKYLNQLREFIKGD